MEPPRYTETELRIHALTDTLISRHGAFSPIDLLLHDGRLTQADYQAWRRGEITWLSERLSCSPQRANALLGIAASWARTLGLTPQPLIPTCWQGEAMGRPLEFCAPDSTLDAALLGYGFHPPTDCAHHQGNLFMDSPVTVTLSQLGRALLARDRQAAQSAWDGLRTLNPTHPLLGCARELLDHLRPGSLLNGHAGEDYHRLRSLQADASEYLEPAAIREYMAPHWLELAQRLNPKHFDCRHPELHSASIYLDLYDYDAAREAVHACTDFRKHAGLMHCLIQADFGRDDRLAGLNSLCQLTWTHPETGLDQWEHLQEHEPSVCAALQALDESESLENSDLPALLLLAEPGLARHIETDGEAPASFVAARELCLHHGTGPRQMQLRVALQQQQPALLQRYLAARKP